MGRKDPALIFVEHHSLDLIQRSFKSSLLMQMPPHSPPPPQAAQNILQVQHPLPSNTPQKVPLIQNTLIQNPPPLPHKSTASSQQLSPDYYPTPCYPHSPGHPTSLFHQSTPQPVAADFAWQRRAGGRCKTRERPW
jgi:hypothetical protein